MQNQSSLTEPTETIAVRQYAKIQHLQSENQSLQEQLRDMQAALKLNKELLKIALETTTQNNSNNTNSLTTNNSSAEEPSQIQSLMQLYEQNIKLFEQHQKVTEERNFTQNKFLLQSQIQQESQGYNQDIISDLEDKLLELRRCLQDKEYSIQEIEKSRTLKSTDDQFIKIREIATPNEQTLRLHEELESTRNQLNKMSSVSLRLSEQNQLLRDMNSNFKKELIKLRIVLRNPVQFYKMKQFIYDDEEANLDQNSDFKQDIEQASLENSQKPTPQQIKYLTNNERQALIIICQQRAICQEKLQKSETQLKNYKELYEKEKNSVTNQTQQYDEYAYQLRNQYTENAALIKQIMHKDEELKTINEDLNYYRSQYGNYMYLLKNKREAKQTYGNQKKETKPNIDQLKQKFQISENEFAFKHKPDDNSKNVPSNVLDSLKEDQDQGQMSGSGLQNAEVDQVVEEGQKARKFASDSKIKKLTIQIEQEPSSFKNKYTATTMHKSKPQSCKNQLISLPQGNPSWNQFKMNLREWQKFLISSTKDFYMTYNLRMDNLQKKLLINNSHQGWQKPLPIWHQKSGSDPLDYFLQEENEEQGGHQEWNNKLFALEESNINDIEQKHQKKYSSPESLGFSIDQEVLDDIF